MNKKLHHMSQALLVMDIQAGIVSRIAQPETLLNNIKETIASARTAQVKIIYVTVQFREGFPEISNNNKGFSAIKVSPMLASPEAVAIHKTVAPVKDDIHVIKRRISAFTGSDLEVILRANSINDLVLCGVSTGGVVLSTLREAADKDYRLTVLHDCCADADTEVHDVLVRKVFPRQAEVLDHLEWIEQLNK